MIKGENVYLRALEPSDLELLYVWENDVENWRVSNVQIPFSKSTLKAYIDGVQDIYTTKQLRLIIALKESQQAIGAIDLFDFDPHHQRAGLGILIGEKGERQKGYAAEALQLCITYAFQTLDLHQLYCNVLSDNQRSLKLFEQNGFARVGEKRDWVRSAEKWQSEWLLQRIR